MKNKKNITKTMLLVIVSIIIETILIRIFMYEILPSKYFYDSNKILKMLNGLTVQDKAFTFVADIFRSVNFFNLQTIQQWGIYVSFIFFPIICYFVARKREINWKQLIFVLASVGLLNIYVLGLTKETVQLFFCIIIYLILMSTKMKNIKKCILISGILAIESLYFRVYYLLIAILLISLYFIYKRFFRNAEFKRSNKKIIILIFIAFFGLVYGVSLISNDNYNSIINARSSVNKYRENSADAYTIINDIIPNNNIFEFIANYVINAIRMMFPLELLFKGPLYIIFIVYQLYITFILLQNCKKIREHNCIMVFFLIAFEMVSFIFEPDFGSFVKHQSNLFLIILELTYTYQQKEGIE